MAIKTKTSRDTYRSNVKIRPLRQNGLEAQYQGLDITEVDIDHAGLAIIGRGGHQTRRDIRKVRKQYIVDVPQEEYYPKAELILDWDVVNSPFDTSLWAIDPVTQVPTFGLTDIRDETFTLVDGDGLSKTFQFYAGTTGTCSSSNPLHINDEEACSAAGHTWTPLVAEGYSNGDVLPNGNYIVDVADNNFSMRELLISITESITTVFPQDTFTFQTYTVGSTEMQYGNPEPVEITKAKIVITMVSSAVGSASLSTVSSFLDVPDNFNDQASSHEWRLNGLLKDNSNPRMFYEDVRVDTIMSTEPFSFRGNNLLPRMAQFEAPDARSQYDINIDTIAGAPTGKTRGETHDSAEVLIRQYPKREELFDTYLDNFQWREDVHYLAIDQQVWSRMEELALSYHSSLEAHIGAMLNSNFADEQYIDPNPLSGRIDVFGRLSRIFDTHVDLIFERHPYSVFDQFLDPIDDFRNLQENRFPKEDVANGDVAFEDLQGARQDENCIWNDYFDQQPLDNHDYIERERWSRIDDEMIGILTFDANRSFHIDRREWQESDYVYTATGFINSQTSGQDGIIYREMKR